MNRGVILNKASKSPRGWRGDVRPSARPALDQTSQFVALLLSIFLTTASTFFLPAVCFGVPPVETDDLTQIRPISEKPAVQIERGISIPPLDFLASLLGFPAKLLLWDRKFCNHSISPETEKVLRDYIERNELYDVKFRLNQWAPHGEMAQIFRNKKVGWPYRIIAVPFTLIYSSTGRLLGGLLLSDYYDPFSHTVHIFSDDPAIVLHEAGHAKDFHYRKWRGTYSMARMLPGFNLFQESVATDEAIDYLKITGQREEAVRAVKILYPAYASYVGSYLPAYPIGYLGAILGGHFYGRMEAKKMKHEFYEQDERKQFRGLEAA